MLLQSKPGLEKKYASEAAVGPEDQAKAEHCKRLLQVLDDINLQHLLQQDMPLS